MLQAWSGAWNFRLFKGRNLEFTWAKTHKHSKFGSLYHEKQNYNFLVTWLLKTALNLFRRFCWFFLKITIRYVLLCFVFFLLLLWQWAVNLSLLPEGGDKKTAYGNAHLLLPDRLQPFRSSADENSYEAVSYAWALSSVFFAFYLL